MNSTATSSSGLGEMPDQESPRSLERCVDGDQGRVAVLTKELAEVKEALKERSALAELSTSVALHLIQHEMLSAVLQGCAEAIVRCLDAAFARIWTLNEKEQMLELQASAGMYTHIDGPHGRVPMGKFKIGLIAQERLPHLTNTVVGDPRVGDQEWAKREGMVAFAGYPLIVEDRLIGVIAMFARHEFTEFVMKGLQSIGNQIAVGIERKRAEMAVRESEERFQQMAGALTDVFWMTSPDLREIWYVSPAYEQLWGLSIEGLHHDPDEWIEAVHPDDHDRVVGTLRKLPAGEGKVDLEYRIIRADHTMRWVADRRYLVRNEAGKKDRVVGVVSDITERKLEQAELDNVNRQLIEASRRGGMAEIATSVLHNVGNVLNSVNISASIALRTLEESKVSGLAKAVALMKEHAEDLGRFITSDPRGRLLPDYLAQLAENLRLEQEATASELESLRANIEHIKEIVAMQQSHATVAGVKDIVDIKELVEDSLRINISALIRHGVELVREFEEVPAISVDRHRVLQILVNIERNAKHACQDSERSDKRITVRIFEDGGYVKVSVADNGVGIAEENLARIFNHGFTTRKYGHGFGLHSGALAAKEMGGSLVVHSDGPGRGAVFTLSLPCAGMIESDLGR